ncbi:MAG: 30S ribosomal protein S11 [Alphaproteobacteria bacterium]
MAKPAAKTADVSAKRKARKNVPSAVCHINSTFNNTIVTITDAQGNAVAWSSAGQQGFKGSRKGTPFAAQLAAEAAGRNAREHGVRTLTDILLKGAGAGRESALRALQGLGFDIIAIRDVTGIPHNGCRLPKRRRV